MDVDIESCGGIKKICLVLFRFVSFYNISIIVGYLMPNPFLYILFQTIQLNISTQFKC